MENTRVDELILLAYKQGDYDTSLRLLPTLRKPANMKTSHDLVPHIPDLANADDVTLLHLAARHGWLDIVTTLVDEYGCDCKYCDSKGQTPLHYAAYGGSQSVVEYLILEQHCDPMHSIEHNGGNSLHCACLGGHLDLTKYLITEHGCDANRPSLYGHTPLHAACSSKNSSLSIVKYLINEQHCDPNSKRQHGRTPLHEACAFGHIDIIHYLITDLNYDLNLLDGDGDMPINIATFSGCLNVVKYLVAKQNSDPNFRGEDGRTPLNYACYSGQLDIVQYLIDQKCDPLIPDNDGDMPIHSASLGGHLCTVKYLIVKCHCDPNSRGESGRTPLHYASLYCHMDIIKYLITDQQCDPAVPDDNHDKPIHMACFGGHLKVVQYLITTQHCDPNSKGNGGSTPLHGACGNGCLDLIQYLIAECRCDPEVLDSMNNKPIHNACLGGKLYVVKCLIQEHHCNPNSKGQWDRTPLHAACDRGHMDIIQYLVKEKGCSPEAVDNEGRSPLHLACLGGRTSVVKWLLQDERVNVDRNDLYGRSLLYYAESSDSSFELLELLLPLLNSRMNYPIQSFTKVVFTGNSGAGKSSLAQVIIKLANRNMSYRIVPILIEIDGKLFPHYAIEYLNMSLSEHELTEVKPLTAGIDSYVLKSKTIGNLVLYDLAGQSEYYFSQSVIMETVMRKSPAIFVNLVDLSKSVEEITQAVHYWLNFIVNAASKANDGSFVIMVGSHADVLSEEHLEIKANLVKDLMDRKLKLTCFLTMDCRKCNDDNFFPILQQCQLTLSVNSQPVSIYCHMLYSFLQTKIDRTACQFHELVSYVSTESIIPSDSLSLLNGFLEYLGDKGLIIYLKNEKCQENSWIVIKRDVILKDVNGELYKPKYFRGHHPIASRTGIIRLSSLSELFPQYDIDMLVELMVGMEFCHPVNLSDTKTNLCPIDSTSFKDATDKYLFFPSLLNTERPRTLSSETQLSESELVRFGWCLGCMDYEYQFFTSRFLHVLLLRLAYTFPLPNKNYAITHQLNRLEQRCTVWTNGILWQNEDGISTVVEIIQQKRWVVVTMHQDKEMCTPVEYSMHRSAVIRLVLDLQKELVPDLDTVECLISPSLLQQCMPLDRLPETDLFVISDVAKSMLTCKPNILDYKDGSTKLPTKTALYFEPYHLLSPSSVCELMDDSKNNQLVSSVLLDEVKERCQTPQLESQSHLNLRKHLDKISIFAGRDPLAVAGLDSDTVVKHSQPGLKVPTDHSASLPRPVPTIVSPVSTVDLSNIPDDSTLNLSHLKDLLTALKCHNSDWFDLGLQLEVKYSTLKEIEADYSKAKERMREMLAAWLKGQGGECTKQAIETALSEID